MLHTREAKDKLPEIQCILDLYLNVFGDIPKGFPSSRGFEHMVEMELRVKLVMLTPYRYLKVYKDEIEKTIKELLDMGFIQTNSSPFTSSMVLFKNKDGTMRM